MSVLSKKTLGVMILLTTSQFICMNIQAQVLRLQELRSHRTLEDQTIPIRLIIDEIRQGVQFKQAENVVRRLDIGFAEPGVATDRSTAKTVLADIFSSSLARKIDRPDTAMTEFWDFDITDVKVTLINENTAIANCQLRLHALEQDSTKANLAKTNEIFVFQKHGGRWSVKNSMKFFSFLTTVIPAANRKKGQ